MVAKERNCNESSSCCTDDFAVYADVKELPLSDCPAYLAEGVVGVCTGGTAVVDVFSTRRRISETDMVIIIPHQLVSMYDASEDFSMLFFRLPYPLFMDTMSGMCRMTPDFFFYMRNHYLVRLSHEEFERFRYFASVLSLRARAPRTVFRRESIILLLRVFFWDVYAQFKNDTDPGNILHYTHKEELVYKFFNLIAEHHLSVREVSFYADKLFISPKYLTMVVRDVTGKSAKDWIVEYTILEIKSLLRDTSMDIKDVVRKTCFPSQSLMSRFFRKHTGMSPSQYREQVHL